MLTCGQFTFILFVLILSLVFYLAQKQSFSLFGFPTFDTHIYIKSDKHKMNLSTLKLLVIFLGLTLAIVPTPPIVSPLPQSTIEPAFTAIIAAQATQQPISPVSDVSGEVFSRFVQIWLENMVRYHRCLRYSIYTLSICHGLTAWV